MIAEIYGPTLRRPPFMGSLGAYPDGSLLRDVSNGTVYLVQGGILHSVDFNTFAAHGWDFGEVKTISDAALAALPKGSPLSEATPTAAQTTSARSTVDPNSDDTIASNALSWLSTVGAGPGTSLYSSWKAQVMAALAAGSLDPGGQYGTQSGKCAGSSPTPSASDIAMAGQALGAAGTAASVGAMVASATSVIPIIGAAVGVGELFITLFSKLFGPPVSQLEQKTLCPAVAAANGILRQITAELKAGYISAAQADSAVNELVSAFKGQVASILYIQTPNDTQFMESSLGAIAEKNSAVVYPQLEAQANSAKASAATSQQNQINSAVQKAVAAAVPSTPAPASVPAGPAVTPSGSAANFLTEDQTIAGYKIPDWALLLGAGLGLLLVAG